MIPKGAAEMVAATIRTLFAQPTAEGVRVHLDTVADMLGEQFPKVKEMLLDAEGRPDRVRGLPPRSTGRRSSRPTHSSG